jgi:hypothetical protein
MLVFTRNRLRSRDGALAYRIVLLEAALQNATNANSNMCRELAKLRAENSRLRAVCNEPGSSDYQRPRLPEMTAGTSVRPRRSRVTTA